MGMSLAMGLSLTAIRRAGGGLWSPSELLTGASQLAYYDPSDLTTLFQDNAGTTPVTTDGQSVGRVLDKSGNGNHLIQSTLASRPLYGFHPATGVRNLLTKTEQFDDAVWSTFNASITANSATAPDGTTTADTLTGTADGSQHLAYRSYTAFVNATGYKLSIFAKAGTNSFLYLGAQSFGGAIFDLTIGTVGSNVGSGVGSIQSVGDGWYRCVVSVTATGTSSQIDVGVAPSDTSASGAATGTLFIWGAQLETGSTATAYQRVNTVNGVTEQGVPTVHFLKFDGSDDFLVSAANLNPGAVDKAQVFVGVRNLSAAAGMVAELGPDAANNSGSVGVFTNKNADNDYAVLSRGTIARQVRSSPIPAPTTNILAALSDISGDNLALRVDGNQVDQNTIDQGTGNFLSQTFYVGRRQFTSPFNGNIYSLLIRFSAANLAADVIDSAEGWTASRSGVPLPQILSLDIFDRTLAAITDRSGSTIQRRA